jgi:salicylate hydroxylase
VSSTLIWPLFDRDPLDTWIHPSGKVALLGDACHPMLVRFYFPFSKHRILNARSAVSRSRICHGRTCFQPVLLTIHVPTYPACLDRRRRRLRRSFQAYHLPSTNQILSGRVSGSQAPPHLGTQLASRLNQKIFHLPDGSGTFPPYHRPSFIYLKDNRVRSPGLFQAGRHGGFAA